MPKKLNIEDYELDYKHACMHLNDLEAYFRFMLKDGNIRSETYSMLNNSLHILFEQYKRLYTDVVGVD